MNIKLFSLLAEKLGDTITVDVAAPLSATALKEAVGAAYPAYADLIDQSVVAVDQDYATDTQLIVATSEVALIPPVSGG